MSSARIHDVALRAKVSVGTVSKALNNKGRLRQETRERIIAAANDLDFRPNSLAQSLHWARSMTVGILSTNSLGRFTFPILEALERRLFDHGIAVFMCNATDDPVRERRHIEQLLGKRVDGLFAYRDRRCAPAEQAMDNRRRGKRGHHARVRPCRVRARQRQSG